MGRNGAGCGSGGGGGGGKGRKGYGQTTLHYGGKGGQESGAWAPRAQQGGWGQPSPGWPQHPQAQGWGPQEQSWGRPSNGWSQPAPYGKGGSGSGRSPQGYGPYSGQESRERRNGQGVWQGFQDVTAAARVALDTARELRSLGTPAPAPAPGQPQVTDQSGAGCGWLAAARSWLLGGLPDQRPPPSLPPPYPRTPQC